jgi:hypothetical protein
MDAAHPVHTSCSRLRLRIPARRRDAAWFAEVAAALAAQPEVIAIRTDAGRASLTLHLRPDAMAPADLRAGRALAAAGLHLVQHTPPTPSVRAPRAGRKPALGASSRQVRTLRADRRTLALGVLLLLLTRHLLRNGWLAPGLALAWFLWESFPMLRHRLSGRR